MGLMNAALIYVAVAPLLQGLFGHKQRAESSWLNHSCAFLSLTKAPKSKLDKVSGRGDEHNALH